MRLLVVTRADSRVKEITKLTHPIIKRFTKQWNADFLVIGPDADCNDCSDWKGRLHYRIMKLYNLFEKYDRIANIDSDTIINKNCPNLFEIVPNGKFGVIFEDKGTRLENRRRRILGIQRAWGDIGWRTGYINTGVSIISQSHREIFKKFKGQYWEGRGYTDVHFGYQLHRLDLEIFELDWHFNHMCMFSERWNESASRFDSYILHYAGKARFPDKGNRSKVRMIRDDIERIYG
ncbi:MAG: hypothetical protein E3J87_03435 [Candidatus Cloacimonadota bacterium]|nr:MAG: hypothetical protein E3J87_03435 [Candidatus Cloacimonadota bacterium]